MPEQGLAADTARRSCGGESSKHSLRARLEDDEPGRSSLPNLKPEIWPSGCRRLDRAELEKPLVLVKDGRRRLILRRLVRGQLHVGRRELYLWTDSASFCPSTRVLRAIGAGESNTICSSSSELANGVGECISIWATYAPLCMGTGDMSMSMPPGEDVAGRGGVVWYSAGWPSIPHFSSHDFSITLTSSIKSMYYGVGRE